MDRHYTELKAEKNQCCGFFFGSGSYFSVGFEGVSGSGMNFFLIGVVLLQIHFGSGLRSWPDPDPEWYFPDPAKSFGCDRNRIHNTEENYTVKYSRRKTISLVKITTTCPGIISTLYGNYGTVLLFRRSPSLTPKRDFYRFIQGSVRVFESYEY